MKILIMSDSHGRSYYMERAILAVSPMDHLIHLGDIDGEEEYLRDIAPCPVSIVSGNNDFFSREPREEVLHFGQYTLFLTHGHRQGVYSGTGALKEAARLSGANIAVYGHTHIPLIDLSDDVWVVNPGSISLPRQEGRKPSYAVMEIDRSGKAHFTLHYFDK